MKIFHSRTLRVYPQGGGHSRTLQLEGIIFQLSVGVKASLVESQRMSSVVFISFHRFSFRIHFLTCSFHLAFISFHVAFMSFHFAFMSFHVPSLCIKDTGLRKLIC